MSLKNDIEMVKEELNSEEKFFEKAVVTEKFVKKYKNTLIGTLALIVIVVSGNIVYEIKKQNTISNANATLAQLEKTPSDKVLNQKLQSLSPALFDAWTYSRAIASKDMSILESIKGTKTPIVSDLIEYELAQNSKDIQKLDNYASKQGAIYKDFALIQSAILLLKDKKIKLAHDKLSTIQTDSALYRLAVALRHYGVK